MCWDWIKASEPLALWVEGLALVAIFIWDRKDAKDQHEETLEQHAIWRRQIHADRVAGIYQDLRHFVFVVATGIREDDFGPGRRFERVPDDPHEEPYPLKAFAAILEAHHLSILINEQLAAYVGERVAEAVALQGVDDNEEFNRRLAIFWKNWEGKRMAEVMRKLS